MSTYYFCRQDAKWLEKLEASNVTVERILVVRSGLGLDGRDTFKYRGYGYGQCLAYAKLYKRVPKKGFEDFVLLKRNFVMRKDLRNSDMVSGNENLIHKVADFGHVREWTGIGWIKTGEYRSLLEIDSTIPVVVDKL